jgi:hypothetical protein
MVVSLDCFWIPAAGAIDPPAYVEEAILQLPVAGGSRKFIA